MPNITRTNTREKVNLYQKEWRKKHLDYSRNYARNYMREWRLKNGITISPTNPLKVSCRATTRYYVKVGKLIKKPCEMCGNNSVEAHHPNYNKILEVNWLCKIHHSEWHIKNKAIEPIKK